MSQPDDQYVVYHKVFKCQHSKCALSEKVSDQKLIMNQFVSQDAVIDRCEILTDNQSLISKYNEIIEANDPLYSTHAFDVWKFRNPQTGQIYKFNYKLMGDVTPFISKFIPVNDMKRPAVTEIVSKLVEHGIIKRMCSPWAISSVWVSKAKHALTKAEAEAQGKEYIPMANFQCEV